MEPGGCIFGREETVSPLMLNPGDKHSHVMHTHTHTADCDTPWRPDRRRDAFGVAESGTFGPRVCSAAKAHVTGWARSNMSVEVWEEGRWPPNPRYERDKRLRIRPVPVEWVRPWS